MMATRMTIFEIRPHRGVWQWFEAPGVALRTDAGSSSIPTNPSRHSDEPLTAFIEIERQVIQ